MVNSILTFILVFPIFAFAKDTVNQGKDNLKKKELLVTPEHKPIQVIKKDTNGDGRIDRIETIYKDESLGLLIVVTEVDSNFTGHFDKKFTYSIKLYQEVQNAVDCPPRDPFTDLRILSQKLGGKGPGHTVHPSCNQKWGEGTFSEALSSGIDRGVQCLKELSQENFEKGVSPNVAYTNLTNLDFLLRDNKVSIVCHERDYKWKNVLAHASAFLMDEIKGLGVTHPFISLNPRDPKSKGRPTENEIEVLQKTLFHESLHNLGYLHVKDIEFAYACEDCCFGKKDNAKKKVACRICAGNYSDSSDKKYLQDMIEWSKLGDHFRLAQSAILKYQKEFPHDRWGVFAYADISSHVLSPLGSVLTDMLKQRHSPLTDDEMKRIKANEVDKSELHSNEKVATPAKMIAEAYYAGYYEGNSSKMIEILEQNKKLIKDLVRSGKTTNGGVKLSLLELQKNVSDMLTDVWLNDYPNENKTSDRALKLREETGVKE